MSLFDHYKRPELACPNCGPGLMRFSPLDQTLFCNGCGSAQKVPGDESLSQHMDNADYRGFWNEYAEEPDILTNDEWDQGTVNPKRLPALGQPRQGGWAFEASKIDWLMNRPDKFKETPEGQQYLQWMQANPQYDALFPWMWSQARKGEIHVDPIGTPNFTQTQGQPNMQGINNYAQAYQQEYGLDRPHWMPYSPEDFSLDYNTYGQPYNTSEHPAAYGAMLERLQANGQGMINDQPYELWKSWKEPTDPIDQETLDRWAEFAKDKNHPVRQQAGNIDQLSPNEMDAYSKDWHFQKNNSKPIFNYNNGWTIRQLQNAQDCRYEGDEMGYCVGGYGNNVESGNALIYSLRDKQNRPHATFEVNPPYRAYNGHIVDLDRIRQTLPNEEDHAQFWRNYGADPDRYQEINHALRTDPSVYPFRDQQERNAYGNMAHSFPGESLSSSPHGGTIEQIQGKENGPPNEKYQKMLKHYFLSEYDDENRPRWETQYISTLPELRDHYGEEGGTKYHAGDYGLDEPDVQADIPFMADQIAESAGGGYGYGIDENDVRLLARHAVDQGEEHELESHVESEVESAKEQLREEIADRMEGELGEWEYDNPPPSEEDFQKEDEDGYPTGEYDEDAYEEARDKWQDERDHYEENKSEELFDDEWSENPWNEMEDAVYRGIRDHRHQLKQDANPWKNTIFQSMPLYPSDARNLYMKAKEDNSVEHLRNALLDLPRHQWGPGHHALLQHVNEHLGYQ